MLTTRNANTPAFGCWLRNVMMLRSAINITHIPEEQVAYRQCSRPSLPSAKAWLREARRRPGYAAKCVLLTNGLVNTVDACGSFPETAGILCVRYTVKPLLADTPNNGHLLYSGQCAMYQVLLPFIPYLRNLRLANTS